MNGFLPQTEDLAVIGTLVLLEALLSADNALVLALQVAHLPKEKQSRALLYGVFGAFLLRGIGILFARILLGLWWLCGVGAAYLVWIGARHFLRRSRTGGGASGSGEEAAHRGGPGFWQTVALVELTDLAFAVDSILVAVALTRKLWVIYIGGVLGILLLRLAAGYCIRLIERYPALDSVAYALVAWAGVKLGAKTLELYWVSGGKYTLETVPHVLPGEIFWGGMAVIVAAGVWHVRRRRRAE